MPTTPTAIKAFSDNYIWAIIERNQCVVVDPGDAAPVLAFLERSGLQLSGILVTHHHPDHVGGIARLLQQTSVPVYGPQAENIPACTYSLRDGDRFTPEGTDLALEVIAVPGHTLGHIAFYDAAHGWLFCGDTLFAGGCGRLFEGTPAQMLTSLDKLAALPGDTRVFCAHEYTQANLTFAASVTPDDPAVIARLKDVTELRKAGRITLPSTIATERQTNPFLRAHETALQAACHIDQTRPEHDRLACFTALRRWKDQF